jgi:hypothetical protein
MTLLVQKFIHLLGDHGVLHAFQQYFGFRQRQPQLFGLQPNPPKLRLAISALFQCHELVRFGSCFARL